MTALEEIGQSLHEIDRLLEDPRLLPDPERNWEEAAAPLAELLLLISERVIPQRDAALAELDELEQLRLKAIIARRVSAAAAVVAASGRRSLAGDLLDSAAGLANGAQHDLLEAARRFPEWWVRLAFAQRLRATRAGRADRLLNRIRRAAPAPSLRDAAAATLAEPQPLRSAPPLSTFNGFGTKLYGRREPRPDGSYVATLYLVALFIPLWPLAAYRVMDQGDGAFAFFGKVPLSGAQRWHRRVLGAVVAVSLSSLGVVSYLRSEPRLAGIALDQARAEEKQGHRDAALEAYERIFQEHPATGAARKALAAWLELELQRFPSPFALDRVSDAERVSKVLETLPVAVRDPSVDRRYGTALAQWADALGADRDETARGALQLLERAAALSDRASREEIDKREAGIRRALAARLAPEWPVAAVEQYLKIGDPSSLAAAGDVLLKLSGEPSVLVESDAEVRRWLAAAKGRSELAEAATALQRRVDEAPKELLQEGRDELLENGSPDALEAAAKRWPRDQGVAAALARARRDRGDVKGALEALAPFGPAGRMIGDAQLALALCLADTGRTADAEAILTRYVDRWLPVFHAASADVERRVQSVKEREFAAAQAGHLPKGITQELERAQGDEAKQQELIGAYLEEQLRNDRDLNAARESYQRHAGVVGASLRLGSLRLERAARLEGDERKAALAAAEAAYAGVQAEAEGSVQFHLGMGQVMHWLGKADEGERHLAAVLERKDPALGIEVAGVYRELGLLQRAREVAEGVFNSAGQPFKDGAAHLLSAMGTSLADREAWLGKIAQVTPEMAAERAELRGSRKSDEGQFAEAEKEFAQALAYYEPRSKTNDSAANNAAVVYVMLYDNAGDPAHLEKAAQLYERALRLNPTSAIVQSNLSYVLETLARLEALEPYVNARALRLQSQDADTLLSRLLYGSLSGQIGAAIRRGAHYRRMLDSYRKGELIAPNNPKAYAGQLDWFEALRDEPAIRALAARADRVGTFDHTAGDEIAKAFIEGRNDGEIRKTMRTQLAKLAPSLANPHGPTRAAALALTASYEAQLSLLDEDPQLQRAAVGHFRDTEAAWPELGAGKAMPALLLDVALLKAAGQDASWEKVRREDWRKLDHAVLIYRAVQSKAAPLEKLRAQPEFAEAVAAASRVPPRTQGVTEWILGSLAGDAKLRASAVASLADPVARLSEQLLDKLSPSARQAARAEVIKAALAGDAKAAATPP